MPAYAFEALDDQGATRKGLVEADSVKAARGMLRAQSLIPLQVQPVVTGLAPGAGILGGAGWRSRPVFSATGLAV